MKNLFFEITATDQDDKTALTYLEIEWFTNTKPIVRKEFLQFYIQP